MPEFQASLRRACAADPDPRYSNLFLWQLLGCLLAPRPGHRTPLVWVECAPKDAAATLKRAQRFFAALEVELPVVPIDQALGGPARVLVGPEPLWPRRSPALDRVVRWPTAALTVAPKEALWVGILAKSVYADSLAHPAACPGGLLAMRIPPTFRLPAARRTAHPALEVLTDPTLLERILFATLPRGTNDIGKGVCALMRTSFALRRAAWTVRPSAQIIDRVSVHVTLRALTMPVTLPPVIDLVIILPLPATVRVSHGNHARFRWAYIVDGNADLDDTTTLPAWVDHISHTIYKPDPLILAYLPIRPGIVDLNICVGEKAVKAFRDSKALTARLAAADRPLWLRQLIADPPACPLQCLFLKGLDCALDASDLALATDYFACMQELLLENCAHVSGELDLADQPLLRVVVHDCPLLTSLVGAANVVRKVDVSQDTQFRIVGPLACAAEIRVGGPGLCGLEFDGDELVTSLWLALPELHALATRKPIPGITLRVPPRVAHFVLMGGGGGNTPTIAKGNTVHAILSGPVDTIRLCNFYGTLDLNNQMVNVFARNVGDNVACRILNKDKVRDYALIGRDPEFAVPAPKHK